MLKINYVFREMKQADILKAYCILFGGQSRTVPSYSCSKIVSQGGETEDNTSQCAQTSQNMGVFITYLPFVLGKNPVLKIGSAFLVVG